MNDNIRRITELRKSLSQLNRMISDGEAEAAGIRITVAIGANAEDNTERYFEVDLGIPGGIPNILCAIKQGIENTIAWRKRDARKELVELDQFFALDGEDA